MDRIVLNIAWKETLTNDLAGKAQRVSKKAVINKTRVQLVFTKQTLAILNGKPNNVIMINQFPP